MEDDVSDPFVDAVEADVNYYAEEKRFSICTLMTNSAQYFEMLKSFQSHGFNAKDCEFLYLDNSTTNRWDAFAGLNLFLNTARGRYIILCHQDIRLHTDGINQLEMVLSTLELHDPRWAVAGNAGGTKPGNLVIRITDPYGADIKRGPFPAQVTALDENFLVVRRSANLTLSGDIHGFHLYGADLCMIAGILGYKAYVVDFHLTHLSPGNIDVRFHQMVATTIRKYGITCRSRWIVTPSVTFFVTRSTILSYLANTKIGRTLARAWARTLNIT